MIVCLDDIEEDARRVLAEWAKSKNLKFMTFAESSSSIELTRGSCSQSLNSRRIWSLQLDGRDSSFVKRNRYDLLHLSRNHCHQLAHVLTRPFRRAHPVRPKVHVFDCSPIRLLKPVLRRCSSIARKPRLYGQWFLAPHDERAWQSSHVLPSARSYL